VWRQRMNVESILTGIITGVLTGGITGYFTALYAMRQFKAQRAFDRQLDWYERTARALGTFVDLNEQYTAEAPGRKITFEEYQKGMRSLEQCVNEAILYADPASYEQLYN